jgi:hypothetical protein
MTFRGSTFETHSTKHQHLYGVFRTFYPKPNDITVYENIACSCPPTAFTI